MEAITIDGGGQPSQTDRLVAERLRAGGVRYTPARRHVVRALHRAAGPLSAGEISAALEGAVPLSSIYRTLNVLEASGVATPHHGARNVIRYELAEWLAGHHHHVVCVECGRVDDVALPDHAEVALEDVVSQAARQAGFAVEDHALEIEGVCRACAP